MNIIPELVPESIILLLDTSRSMFRRDYSPNRLDACKHALMHFIQTRQDNEATLGGSSAFALISIDTAPEIKINLDDYATRDIFEELFESCTPKGNSAIWDGFAFALKVLIEDIRHSGARAPHIIMISDGKASPSRVDPEKMANLAKQTGIRVDTIKIGDVETVNLLKQIATISEGQYYFADNLNELVEIMTRLATPNVIPTGGNYGGKKRIISRKVLKKIAVPLRSESEMNKGSTDQKELISRLRGTKSYQKCSICFQSDDPYTKGSFSLSGRYCPNCGTPMHASCAAQWGRNQDKEGDGTIFRCVHCLYLLKIPSSMQTKVQMHQNLIKETRARKKKQTQVQTFNVAPQLANTLGEAALYSACPVCSGIFEEDDQVIACGNPDCNAIYHLAHFDKLPNHRCKVCGAKLVRLFQ